ncbi:MAG: hypothetical protein JWQ09_5514 [Segetibacter sp.]|nr:hypothetical protein [Segetibacter sp.]
MQDHIFRVSNIEVKVVIKVGFMEEIRLNPSQSWSATVYFLNSIWEHRKERLPARAV